jgi:hypothetical protein
MIAKRVMCSVVPHGLPQDPEVRHLRGAPRERRRILELLLGHQLGATCSVVYRFNRHTEILEVLLALRQRLRMRVHDRDIGDLRAGQRLQAMDDIELHFAGDHELVIEEQVVVAMNGAANRVLERHHAVRGALLHHRLEHFIEALARHRFDLRSAVHKRGGLAIGAGFSLIRESHE